MLTNIWLMFMVNVGPTWILWDIDFVGYRLSFHNGGGGYPQEVVFRESIVQLVRSANETCLL